MPSTTTLLLIAGGLVAVYLITKEDKPQFDPRMFAPAAKPDGVGERLGELADDFGLTKLFQGLGFGAP